MNPGSRPQVIPNNKYDHTDQGFRTPLENLNKHLSHFIIRPAMMVPDSHPIPMTQASDMAPWTQAPRLPAVKLFKISGQTLVKGIRRSILQNVPCATEKGYVVFWIECSLYVCVYIRFSYFIVFFMFFFKNLYCN